MDNAICIHHNDIDGICSAAIINMINGNQYNMEFVSVDYGAGVISKLPPLVDGNAFLDYTRVFIVDFTLPDAYMAAIVRPETVNKVVWIDHHGSSVRKFEGAQFTRIDGIRVADGPLSAAMLTWKWCVGSYPPAPEVVHMVSNYDVWNLSPKTLNAHYALEAYDLHPADKKWLDLMEMDSGKFHDTVGIVGEYIQSYERAKNKEIVLQGGYITTFLGYPAIACCAQGKGSSLFDNFDVPDNVIKIVYWHSRDIWNIRLYQNGGNTDRDLSKIAEQYGGGGHHNACGFEDTVLPFKYQSNVDTPSMENLLKK